jgi:hypothetical protein
MIDLDLDGTKGDAPNLGRDIANDFVRSGFAKKNFAIFILTTIILI